MKPFKPPRLAPGDTVAAISLSSGAAAAYPERYAAGKRQLEASFGVRVVETPNALRDHDWLYRNPEARADDLHWALGESEVRAIVSIIGGDDSVRILPYWRPSVLRESPKVFMGFSDSTITLNAFQSAGVVAFHGPALMTDIAENRGIHPFTERSMRSLLFLAESPTLGAAPEWTEEFLDWRDPHLQWRRRAFLPSEGWSWLQGEESVDGHLMGGNIEVLEFLKGTAWWPPLDRWAGAILCFETSEEAPPVRSVGRFLRNYGSQGILGAAAGLLFARPKAYSAEQRWLLYEEIRRVLGDFGREDLPVVANMDFGHTSPQLVLPLGCLARIDPVSRTVRLLEPAVS